MRMIYGSMLLVNNVDSNRLELAEREKLNVTRMITALEAYPWENIALSGLVSTMGVCAMAVNSTAEGLSPTLLPLLTGLTIAADARLDNRTELSTALGITTAEQTSLDDCALILCAYQKWGTDCVTHLLGDFAFGMWDETAGRLFCVRDITGVRPFYYHHDPATGRFVFASDLFAMAAHPDVPLGLNKEYVLAAMQQMSGQFMNPEHTSYQAIEKLPPAHCLTLDASGLKRWAYWQPGQTAERRYTHEQDYVEELLLLLKSAVACRVDFPGRYPVGAHISGGLDSSSVAVLANRLLKDRGRNFTGFSWAPPLPEDPHYMLPNDERMLVEAVRAAEGMPIHYTQLTAAHIVAHARRDITLQPTASLQFELAASEDAANLGIHTMLSGWGGDELLVFNGRGYFPDLLRRGHWMTLHRELNLRSRLHGHGDAGWRQWIGSGLVPLLPSFLRSLRYPDNYAPLPLPTYLRPDFAASLVGVEPLVQLDARERPGVRCMQIRLLQHGHLSYRMESWASHGATLGITYAYPLLDQRLVEFALSIPDFLFFKNGWKRYLYRTAMAGILPDSLRWQKVKEDPAMVRGARNARSEEVAEQLKAQLQTRAGNPYIDVDKLQAGMDAEMKFGEALNDDSLSQRERRRLRLLKPSERVRWLAFINPDAYPNKDHPV